MQLLRKTPMTVKTSFRADIRFPTGGLKPILQGQGQNGRVLMTGLSLSAYADFPFATLNPITSRGEVSKSAGFEVPYDKQTLTTLANLTYEFSKSAETFAQELCDGKPLSLPAIRRSDVKYPVVTDPERWPMARGRNKRSFVSALELSIAPAFKAITIRPYNSLARLTPYCSLEVAFDPVTLQALADAFLAMANDTP